LQASFAWTENAPEAEAEGPAPELSTPPQPEEPEASDELDDFAEERLEDVDDLDMEEERPRRRPGREGDRRRGGGRRMGGGGRPGMGRPKPLIQDIFRRGQEVLVQVIKEGIGTKGPTLSTYISIAGRYLVLMPGLNRIGVSRKIADDDQRRRLREILSALQPPKGLGFIIRTAGMDRTKRELQRDLAYLARLWQVVVRRIRKLRSPCEIYQESDMITRTIRDTFTAEIDTIWVDEPAAFEAAQEFMQVVMPRYANRIKQYADSEPMFHKHGLEEEIIRIQQRHVPLPMGGSIVIDQAEALVAIDVNSGNFRADNNAEETAYRMNLLAAKEIARQLRLRDLGGVIVNDFIDMREERHRRDVERALRDAVRRDRARTKLLRMSQFGIIEMTRQRIRPSLKRSVYQDCPHCVGTGQVKTCESMSIDVMRMIQLAAHRDAVARIQIRVHDDVANYLLNKKRKEITKLEEAGEIQVTINGMTAVSPETLEFVCYDNNNNEVKFNPQRIEDRRPARRY
jgi:ribonuclease E